MKPVRTRKHIYTTRQSIYIQQGINTESDEWGGLSVTYIYQSEDSKDGGKSQHKAQVSENVSKRCK